MSSAKSQLLPPKPQASNVGILCDSAQASPPTGGTTHFSFLPASSSEVQMTTLITQLTWNTILPALFPESAYRGAGVSPLQHVTRNVRAVLLGCGLREGLDEEQVATATVSHTHCWHARSQRCPRLTLQTEHAGRMSKHLPSSTQRTVTPASDQGLLFAPLSLVSSHVVPFQTQNPPAGKLT